MAPLNPELIIFYPSATALKRKISLGGLIRLL